MAAAGLRFSWSIFSTESPNFLKTSDCSLPFWSRFHRSRVFLAGGIDGFTAQDVQFGPEGQGDLQGMGEGNLAGFGRVGGMQYR